MKKIILSSLIFLGLFGTITLFANKQNKKANCCVKQEACCKTQEACCEK